MFIKASIDIEITCSQSRLHLGRVSQISLQSRSTPPNTTQNYLGKVIKNYYMWGFITKLWLALQPMINQKKSKECKSFLVTHQLSSFASSFFCISENTN